MLIDEAIEILTKMMIHDDFNDKQNNKTVYVKMKKVDLYKFCINLLKILKRSR